MKDSTREKLDKLDQLYPQTRITGAKTRWQAILDGHKSAGRYPWHLPFPHFNAYNENHPAAERLERYLDASIFLGQFDDDSIPSIFPGCKQSTIPTMFGAKEIMVGDDYSCETIINSPEAAAKLAPATIPPGSTADSWLEMQKYIMSETAGRIPVHVCDMQGPFEVAAKLMGYDNMFLLAMDEPDAFDQLMEKMTQAFLLLWKRQQEICGENFLGCHFYPWNILPAKGYASVSADSMVMVSPDFFDRHYGPCIHRISQELGSLAVHSCGDWRKVVPNLCKVKGVKLVNASQLSVEQLIQAGLTADKIFIGSVHYDKLQQTMRTVSQNIAGAFFTIDGVWPETPLETWNEADISQVQRKIEQVNKIMSSIY